jgi:hypothetical protein
LFWLINTNKNHAKCEEFQCLFFALDDTNGDNDNTVYTRVNGILYKYLKQEEESNEEEY